MSDPAIAWHEKFDELVGALRTGELSADGANELEAMLASQPNARRRFAELMQLEAMLGDELPLTRLQHEQHSPTSNQTSYQVGRPPRATQAWRILATCALVLLLGAFVWLSQNRNSPHNSTTDLYPVEDVIDDGVAVVTRMVGVQWGAETRHEVGSTVAPGMLELESGLVQLEFYQGAVVVVEGPARLEMISSDKLVCLSGKLRAHVPSQASGFTVLSQQFELVDLGTEFGIEVASDGSAAVQVFDGKVELYDVDSGRSLDSRRELTAAKGVAVSVTGAVSELETDGRSFVSPDQLKRLAQEDRLSRMAAWQEKRDQLMVDPRVVVYYSFDEDETENRVLRSQLPDDRSLDGAIIGCTWTPGRWPGKRALEFKRPGDRVRVDIPGKYESMTWSAWLRVDGLDRRFSSLLLTDGFDPCSPHWQIHQDGRLILGLRYPSSARRDYETQPLIDVFGLGQWTHLLTVHDGAAREVYHYVDGQLSSRESFVKGAAGPLQLGKATIGNWVDPINQQNRVRNLNGRIDELIVFREALGPEEVLEIYNSGKP